MDCYEIIMAWTKKGVVPRACYIGHVATSQCNLKMTSPQN